MQTTVLNTLFSLLDKIIPQKWRELFNLVRVLTVLLAAAALWAMNDLAKQRNQALILQMNSRIDALGERTLENFKILGDDIIENRGMLVSEMEFIAGMQERQAGVYENQSEIFDRERRTLEALNRTTESLNEWSAHLNQRLTRIEQRIQQWEVVQGLQRNPSTQTSSEDQGAAGRRR